MFRIIVICLLYSPVPNKRACLFTIFQISFPPCLDISACSFNLRKSDSNRKTYFFLLGSGYAEVLSYCTCDEETNTPFALCDKRAGICSSKQGNYPTSSNTYKLGKSKLFFFIFCNWLN